MAPVDSKGAADELDKILFEWVPAGTRHRLKQAILALLAQEVKSAYEQGQKDGYSPGIKPTKMTAEQIREYNRLAKHRSRRKAGLV